MIQHVYRSTLPEAMALPYVVLWLLSNFWAFLPCIQLLTVLAYCLSSTKIAADTSNRAITGTIFTVVLEKGSTPATLNSELFTVSISKLPSDDTHQLSLRLHFSVRVSYPVHQSV